MFLDYVHVSNPDILLIDLIIPEKSGMEVINQISKNQSTPIITISGTSDSELITEAIIKTNRFISKPIDPELLTCSIDILLEGNQ